VADRDSLYREAYTDLLTAKYLVKAGLISEAVTVLKRCVGLLEQWDNKGKPKEETSG